eukprot:scaffold2109_cov188-Amphora_coffeaeformis.AAC.9
MATPGDSQGDKNNKGGKEKEGPKRPLSAYNFFFQFERARLVEALPVRAEGKPRRSHGKIGFAELAKVIGAKWRNITPEEKAIFDKMALQEKESYKRELRAFKEAKKAGASEARPRETWHYTAALASVDNPASMSAALYSNPSGISTRSAHSLSLPRFHDNAVQQQQQHQPVDPFAEQDDLEPLTYQREVPRNNLKHLEQQLGAPNTDLFIRMFR